MRKRKSGAKGTRSRRRVDPWRAAARAIASGFEGCRVMGEEPDPNVPGRRRTWYGLDSPLESYVGLSDGTGARMVCPVEWCPFREEDVR